MYEAIYLSTEHLFWVQYRKMLRPNCIVEEWGWYGNNWFRNKSMAGGLRHFYIE